MKMLSCCVIGCNTIYTSTSKLKFYRLPSGYRPFQANRRRLWLQAIQQANGSTEELKANVHICSAHFISGEASMDRDSPDFVPSVFTCTKGSPKKKVTRLYSRRKRRCHKANVGKKETTPGVDSPVDVQSSALMETESEPSEQIPAPSAPSVPKEGEILTEEAEAEAEPGTQTVESPVTSSPKKTLTSFKLPADIPNLNKMNPVVLLKPLVTRGRYQCALCNQNFTSVSQLAKHKQQHEEEQPFICEICGMLLTSQATFTQHKCIINNEPSFPCNMCDRTFTTIHNLKRHKLLHVKDGRKCSVCGVLFCRRHGHTLFLPRADPATKSQLDSSTTEVQEESEQSQTDGEKDNTQSTITATPVLKTDPLKPGILTFILPCSLLCPPPAVPSHSVNPGASSQCMPPQPDNPAIFPQTQLLQHPVLPPSLKLFSPQYLTSALLEVKRNYKYILSKPRAVKKEIVKEEQCEQPLISPDEQKVEQVKKERIAYDLEIVV